MSEEKNEASKAGYQVSSIGSKKKKWIIIVIRKENESSQQSNI